MFKFKERDVYDGIWNKISRKVTYLFTTDFIEFTPELLGKGKKIFKRANESRVISKGDAVVLLATACQIIRDECVVAPGKQIDLWSGLYNSSDIIAIAFDKVGIPYTRRGRRRIVHTLTELMERPFDFNSRFLRFIIRCTEDEVEPSKELLETWGFNGLLPFYRSVVKKGRTLLEIMEFMRANEEELWNTYDFIEINRRVRALGEGYDLQDILFKEESTLFSTLWPAIFLYVTTEEFLQLLKAYPYEIVDKPDGDRVLASTLNKSIPFGRYTFHNREYTLLPARNLSPKTIEDWKFSKIITDGDHIALKRQSPFKVTSPHGDIKSRLYIHNDKSFHLIYEELTVGFLKENETMLWWEEGALLGCQIVLYSQGADIRMALRGEIELYYPSLPREEIELNVIQGESSTALETSLGWDGTGQIIFEVPLSGTKDPVFIKFQEEILKKIDLEDEYFFSDTTRDRISFHRAVEYNQLTYFLFSKAYKEELEYDEAIEVSSLGTWGDYRVYKVVWRSSPSFSLVTPYGRYSISLKPYFEMEFFSSHKGFLSFPPNAGNWICDIGARIFSTTNFEEVNLEIRERNSSLHMKIDLDLSECENTNFGGFYLNAPPGFLYMVPELPPGNYEVRAFANSNLLNYAEFTIMPGITLIGHEDLISDDEIKTITLRSNECIFPETSEDIESIEPYDSYTLSFRPHLTSSMSLPSVYVHDVDVSVPTLHPDSIVRVRFKPKVFSFRIFRKEEDIWEALEHLSTSDLEDSILYVIAYAGAKVEISDGTSTRVFFCNEEGELYLSKENLLWFKEISTSWETEIFLRCDGIIKWFTLIAPPQIYKVCSSFDPLSRQLTLQVSGDFPEDLTGEVHIWGKVLTIKKLPSFRGEVIFNTYIDTQLGRELTLVFGYRTPDDEFVDIHSEEVVLPQTYIDLRITSQGIELATLKLFLVIENPSILLDLLHELIKSYSSLIVECPIDYRGELIRILSLSPKVQLIDEIDALLLCLPWHKGIGLSKKLHKITNLSRDFSILVSDRKLERPISEKTIMLSCV